MCLLSLLATNALAAEPVEDSLRMATLNEVVVKGVRAPRNAPFAVSNISKPELDRFSTSGRELPLLFSQTPGVLAWGENGLGTGTAYMRIRGAAGSRINVTLDGVPLNSPEDQTVFWANMNSYASMLSGAQIQRGVGTSTNGDGAFGGTVALATAAPQTEPGLELSSSYGSYNTYNLGGRFSTGLLWSHLVLDGAYHETNTDGFIHGTAGRSGSYYGGLTYLADHFMLSYKNIGNFEKTGQAWNGVTAGNNDLSLMDGTYGTKTGIKTYKDMYKAGLGRYNSLYEQLAFDGNNYAFVKDGNGNFVTHRYRLRDGSLWKRTTDNFYQDHNILSGAWTISQRWTTNASLHYTYGYGYYNEFRPDNKLKKFGLVYPGIKRSDFVRRKGLSQHTYGLVWNLHYSDRGKDITTGVSLQQFRGNHFGYLTYIGHEQLDSHYRAGGNYKYYDSDARKFDYSGFVKAVNHLSPCWDVYADLQYRFVHYKTGGINDKFVPQPDGSFINQPLDINENYHFFNPKAGISYSRNGHHAYASVAVSNREPERNNFTDNYKYPAPKAERVLDYEAGYQYSSNRWRVGANLYYMDYKDQLVQTGEQSEIGEPLTTNIRKSHRMGVELTAGWDVTPWMTFEGNAALSRNRIKDFDEVASVNWEESFRTIHYDNSTLAFSPSTLLNGFVRLHHRGVQALWHTNFVSRQYLDNTENRDRSLPCFSTSSLDMSYTTSVCKAMGIRQVTLGMQMNNIFGRRYAASGWVYSSIVENSGHPEDNRYYQIGFIPSAGFTAMGYLTVKF